MREELKITYHCDAENCFAKSLVWEKDGKWLGRDLKLEIVSRRECGLPLPPTWTTIGGQHFCQRHNISIRGEPPTGEDVEIIRTGGLYEPVYNNDKRAQQKK